MSFKISTYYLGLFISLSQCLKIQDLNSNSQATSYEVFVVSIGRPRTGCRGQRPCRFGEYLNSWEPLVVVGAPSSTGIAGTLPYLDLGHNQYTGTVQLQYNGSRYCTGSLLASGRRILTAAHCVTDDAGNVLPSFANDSI